MDRELLLTIGARIAPGIDALDAAGRDRVFAIIDQAVRQRPLHVQRQLRLFLQVLRWLPVLRYARPFERLTPREQDAVLGWFLDAPIAPLRHGFWGVKTLVFMGYYGRPEVWAEIGYAPRRSGSFTAHAR